jgi:hypothetical protein
LCSLAASSNSHFDMKLKYGSAVLFFLLSFSAVAQTNQWTNPTSGAWESPYWSLGTLPGADQQFVAIDNAGWKAVAISANTTANYPQSLSLNNLLVDAPTNSMNTLLLNWAYLNVPLVVQSNLNIGPYGSLVSHYSAIQATNVYIDGSASFMDYATEDFGQLYLRSGATVGLTNGIMTCSNLTFYNGAFTQSGGTHAVQTMNLPLQESDYSLSSGAYTLQGGSLTSQQMALGYIALPLGTSGNGYFVQTGGAHTNSAMYLTGYFRSTSGWRLGHYQLEGGLLVSSNINNDGGSFVQSGGTNLIQQLTVNGGSYFGLTGGELIASNVTAAIDLYVNGRFEQTGGQETVLGQLLVQGGGYNNPFTAEYSVSGGSLVVSNLQIIGATLAVSSNGMLVTSNINLGAKLTVGSQGTVSNAGILAVSGQLPTSSYGPFNIDLENATQTQYLGQLKIFSPGCAMNLYSPSNSSVVRFSDSHTQPWTGPLLINYSDTNSIVHIFFGTNAQALTSAQLAQVSFIDNGTNYPAKLLATGELVPAVLPPLSCVNLGNAMVISWPGGYELMSSTNLNGPYSPVPAATTPFTNTFTEPQRFFRLHLPSP